MWTVLSAMLLLLGGTAATRLKLIVPALDNNNRTVLKLLDNGNATYVPVEVETSNPFTAFTWSLATEPRELRSRMAFQSTNNPRSVSIIIQSLQHEAYSMLQQTNEFYFVTVCAVDLNTNERVTRRITLHVLPARHRISSLDRIYIENTTVGFIHRCFIDNYQATTTWRSAVGGNVSTTRMSITESGNILLDRTLAYSRWPYTFNVIGSLRGQQYNQTLSIFVRAETLSVAEILTEGQSLIIWTQDELRVKEGRPFYIRLRANVKNVRWEVDQMPTELSNHVDRTVKFNEDLYFQAIPYNPAKAYYRFRIKAIYLNRWRARKYVRIYVENVMEPPRWAPDSYKGALPIPWKLVVQEDGRLPPNSTVRTPKATSPDGFPIQYYLNPDEAIATTSELARRDVFKIDRDTGRLYNTKTMYAGQSYLVDLVAETFPMRTIVQVRYTLVTPSKNDLCITWHDYHNSKVEKVTSNKQLAWFGVLVIPVGVGLFKYIKRIHRRRKKNPASEKKRRKASKSELAKSRRRPPVLFHILEEDENADDNDDDEKDNKNSNDDDEKDNKASNDEKNPIITRY